MTKTICDICGKEMSTENSVDIIKDLNFCISSYGKMWDVCNKCREELNEWIKQRKTENEEKSDSAPGIEVVPTTNTEKNAKRYYNVNVSYDEIRYNPDVVRLFTDPDFYLEYVRKDKED